MRSSDKYHQEVPHTRFTLGTTLSHFSPQSSGMATPPYPYLSIYFHILYGPLNSSVNLIKFLPYISEPDLNIWTSILLGFKSIPSNLVEWHLIKSI